MLLVDDREKGRPGQSSNRDILEQLRSYRDMEVCVMRLESADCRFDGHGPDGKDVVVGCERKRLSDLIQSMQKRRLSGFQLPNLLREHDFVYIFVEGMWRPGKFGEIEEYRRKGRESGWFPLYGRQDRFAVSYRQVMSYLTTLELKAVSESSGERVVVRRTASAYETASQYVALWQWFNEKRWDQHKSHDQVYTNEVVTGGKRARLVGNAGRGKPSELWKMAAQLPGVDEKARLVAEHFGDVRSMANGTLRDWLSIDGIGKVTAEACIRVMRTGRSGT